MKYIKVLLFGRVRQLEFPPAVIATLNTVVTPHQLNGVRLPGLQTGNLVCLHLAQLLCMPLKHKTSTSYFFFHKHKFQEDENCNRTPSRTRRILWTTTKTLVWFTEAHFQPCQRCGSECCCWLVCQYTTLAQTEISEQLLDQLPRNIFFQLAPMGWINISNTGCEASTRHTVTHITNLYIYYCFEFNVQ